MKASHWIIAAAAFACAEPVQAGVNDPEKIIYRGSGVVDSGGGDFNGNATAFHCTNFSGVNENIRFVVRTAAGLLVSNNALLVPHLNTGTVVTKNTGLFTGTNANTGAVQQGTVAIAATSIHVTCTAMLVQANITTPEGIRLHMTRFNPIPATEE
jgi:hypothetical protein